MLGGGEGTPTLDGESAIEQIGADVEDADVLAVEAESPPPKETLAKPETSPAVPRDERGRFADKPSTPVAQASPEVSPPAETPPEPIAPPVVEEEPSTPATYRADGQEFSIPGSAVGEDGVFTPTDVWQRDILPLLAAGRAARGGSLQKRMQEQAQQVQSWQQTAQAAQAQSQAIIAKIDQMVESNTIGQWLEDVHQQWPIMKAQAEANALRVQNQYTAQQLQTFQAEQQRQALEPQFSQALEQSLQHFGQQAGLDHTQLQGLYEQLNSPQFRQSLFVRVQQDDPMTGLRAGEWAIDNSVVDQWVRWASQYQPKTTSPAVPAKVVEAQKQNAKKVAASPPPVVGSKGGSAPSDKPKPKQYENAKQALREIFDEEGFQNFEVMD